MISAILRDGVSVTGVNVMTMDFAQPPAAGSSMGSLVRAGDKVLYLGLPYQAKWDNQGVSPLTGQGDPSGSPWKALYRTPGEPVSPALAGPIPAVGATSPSPATSPSVP